MSRTLGEQEYSYMKTPIQWVSNKFTQEGTRDCRETEKEEARILGKKVWDKSDDYTVFY